MLTHPLLEQLRELKCSGMMEALQNQIEQSDIQQLSFDERLGLLIEQEMLVRVNRRLASRLRQAKLKTSSCTQDIDYQVARNLSKSVMAKLGTCDWVTKKQNCLITGSTGTGKTYIACALAHQACLQGYTAKYIRMPRLFQDILIAKADGSYSKWMSQLAKIRLLILDDWGIVALETTQQQELLEIMDDRHHQSSTIVTSQLPINLWHQTIGEPTLSDAILDRLVHNAHKIELKGESMRKKLAEPQIKNNVGLEQ